MQADSSKEMHQIRATDPRHPILSALKGVAVKPFLKVTVSLGDDRSN